MHSGIITCQFRTARAEPLWQVVEKLKFIVLMKAAVALAAPDFFICSDIKRKIHYGSCRLCKHNIKRT